MEIDGQYLDVEELAETLNVSLQYIRSLARRGKIGAIKFGNTWLIEKKVLLDKHFLFSIQTDVADQKSMVKTGSCKYKALSFFSGAMGLDIGLEKAGL